MAAKLTAEEQLNLLVEFGKQVSTEFRLDELLDIIGNHITKNLNVGQCTIFLKDVEYGELWSKIAQGKGLDHTEIRIPLNSKNIIAYVAASGTSVNITNAYEDPRFSIELDMVTDFKTVNMLAVPLKNNTGKVLGVFQVANKKDGTVFDNKDEGLLMLLSTLASSAIEIARLYQDLNISQLETIYRLAITAEYRDQRDTKEHLRNISIISYLLALSLGLAKERCNLIKNASPLHDIGKVALADNILLKPAKLTDQEYEIMKAHTIYGGRILEGAHSKVLKMAHKIALSHHEKWNGKGYPKGLAGEEIPLEARIVSVADVFDALCMQRIYKAAWTPEKAYEYMLEESGESFDPRIIEAFKKIFPSVKKIYSGDDKSVIPDDSFFKTVKTHDKNRLRIVSNTTKVNTTKF
ncbi:Response regulator containing a CheY-like receiver domain [Elusimicrobium minutum Pei191]|uniref:Response regulator containing a CheY-like receiver domain n=1 Tax=Elusimicrobium minutum (strain Pei191) TaxID=445932 RepID=B2KAS2_ELUMP|nr:HD domain-containing phosphohydrolase [Elusimicrobium minutum]ACC97618.1 Response regulator containing a CheY-like receiver domain [Elusimicrobium minutum Pei191]